jgi:hypothetical protein
MWSLIYAQPLALEDLIIGGIILFLAILGTLRFLQWSRPRIAKGWVWVWHLRLKGKGMSPRVLRAKHVTKILEDGICDFIEDAVHKGILTRKEANRSYNRLARGPGFMGFYHRRRTTVPPNPSDLKQEIKDTLENKVHSPIPVNLPEPKAVPRKMVRRRLVVAS